MIKSTFVTTFSFGIVALLAACGGDSKPAKPDAKPPVVKMPDAMVVPPDAPPALTGIGAPCDMAASPAIACAAGFACLTTPPATAGYCTKLCVENGTFMTDAQSAPVTDPDLTVGDPTCVAAYTAGPAGVPGCNIFANLMPPPPLKPSTNYTFVGVCGIGCGPNNSCPGTFVCNTQSMLCDLP